MTRTNLDNQINHLKNEVLLLGSMVEQATLAAIDALKRRDLELSRKIYSDDRLINEKRYAIENALIILMSTQSPMARDLRLMAAFLEVTTELERMGDYAKGIAKVSMHLGDHSVSIGMREFSTMAELSVDMLHRALSSFIAQDAQSAYQIPREDDQVDTLYNQVYHSLVSAMIADPASIDHINLLMWVAHDLERMADRVTNICERTVFIATGELMELDTDNEDIND
jgi:phosphate transport system protein